MVGLINTSLSALQNASTRLQVASNNIANQNTTRTQDAQGNVVADAFKPQRVVQTNNGGVPVATIETVANPTQKIYAPNHPDADEKGVLTIPNADTARDLVDIKIASYDYKANLQAIKVQDYLLDILS